MRILYLIISVIILLAALLGLCQQYFDKEATLILYNGNVITLDKEKERAEAIVVNGDRIRFVGENKQAITYMTKETKLIDLKGATVLPGFTDSHMHLSSLGKSLTILDLVATASKEEILQLVKKEHMKLENKKWLIGRGWDQNDWDAKDFPTAKDLDSVVKDRPVCLTRIDGHAIWVNSKAMELAKIDERTTDPAGGKIIREKGTKKPTGIFLDNAAELITKIIPEPTKEEMRNYIIKGMEECVKNGLTMINDAGADIEEIQIYKELAQQDLLLRLYVMISDDEKTLNYCLKNGPEFDKDNYRLMIRSIKLFADGAMGSRGAAFFEPYSDDPDNKGLLLASREKLLKMVKIADKHNWQLCTHAIGDKANYVVLEAYSKGEKTKEARHRIEHAQVVRLSDIPLFSKYNIIASMQPIHATSDMYWAENRVGKERIKGAYAWRSFVKNNVIIAGGSDAPVESVNPILGIYAAVSRKDLKGYPEKGWYPEEKLNIIEAIELYTKNAAYACFMENVKGIIKEGYLADFSILDKDITNVSIEQIPLTKVVHTIVGGKIVY